MSVKTLVFDFGNVIGYFSHRRATERLAPHSPLALEVLHSRIFGCPLENEYECGRISSADFLEAVRTTCQLNCADEHLISAYSDIFWPNHDVCELITRLKPRYRLLLASNTNDLHARWFLRQFAPTLAAFDQLVLSHEAGARKPSAAFFAYCQRFAGCAPSECLFIDDLEANVAGAQAFGWQGIVYRDHAELVRELAGHGVGS